LKVSGSGFESSFLFGDQRRPELAAFFLPFASKELLAALSPAVRTLASLQCAQERPPSEAA
jgi:hypothetical protein